MSILVENPYAGIPHYEISNRAFEQGAQAQLRKVTEWGDEPCPHIHRVLPNRPKHACDICWGELLKEAGL